MDGGETTNSFAFNFFSSSSSSGGKGEEEKRTTTETTNAKETTKTTIQKPEAKRVHSKDVFEPVFAKAVDKETVEIFSSDEEEEEGRAKVLMMSIEKKIPPLGKEEVRMRVPTLDAVCKNNNEKPAKGAKAPPSAASAYSLASHDLVKGKYEGGLKLWECAIDLTKYVVRERVVEAMVTLSKSKSFRVLELGCGHGVPGIASLMAREKMEKDGKDTTLLCTLADYNEEVLTEVTIPNARMNGVCEQCTFLAGDWDDLVAAPSKKQSEAFLSKDEFDLILTSDTIYNVDDAKKLAKVIHHCLKKNANENAIALVAAKRYYFGVGGSTATFMQLCDETSLSCDVVKEIMDGASNVREIIRVRIKT
jgi:SAM-dependent methyltransferase